MLVDTLIPLPSRGFLAFVRTQCTVQVQSYSSQTVERGALSCAGNRGGGSAALSVLHQTKRLQTLGKIKADLKGRRPLLYLKIASQKSQCLQSQNRPSPVAGAIAIAIAGYRLYICIAVARGAFGHQRHR